ncbi:glycosyltransferase family 2 protein [Chloroflexota bacterium]
MPNITVSIIIPALNEEGTIAKVIDEIPKKDLQKVGYRIEIIVIDNNSTDGTAKTAEEKGVKVIVEPVKGKGRAIRTAFKSVSGDFIFMLDADYTYPASYIPRMLEVLQEGHDVVIGSRLKGQMGKGAMSKMNLVGNRLLVFIANILYGTRISDLCTGYWGLTRRVIDNMGLDAKGFELEAAMFAEITKKGYSIAEVPIFYRRRVTPSKLRSLKSGFKIGWTLLKKRFQ